MSLLVFNAGSSSLKFAVFDLGSGTPTAMARGGIAPLNGNATLHLQEGANEIRRVQPVAGIQAAVRESLAALSQSVLKQRPATMLAHRIVCGEPDFGEIERVDDTLLERLRRLGPLAPLHQQAEIEVIRAASEALGAGLPSYAAFDGGFFRDLPAAARNYAIPAELSTRLGIRRAGFHGFAHRSMLEGYCAAADATLSKARVITFQLGGGCSAAAIDGGRVVETSMGFTPLEGLVMETRCGDLDPGVVFECLRSGISAAALYETLERGSGLRGLSGVGSDMRRLLAEAERGHPGAQLAIDVYCHRARKYLGAYLAVLNGADAVVFGGGVGEHQPEIRARICADLEWFGLQIDPDANRQPVLRPRRMSSARSRVAVYAVPVDEEEVIAREVLRVSRAAAPGGG